ncbi:unnamed protein product [Caenorhabditis sp. 36 PRJEB53466]|nr:unnamed protein product [Caenorhabditis sp. 36 PRJEB53466]
MRVLLAISVIYQITIAQKVGINEPCDKELDGLLTVDPSGDEHAFFHCQGVGVGTIAFWERKVCPNNMVFDFINQQCKEHKKKARKQQTLSIAILNNSCANGETCIGGSVCDLDTLRCMCPYGTTPKLDTLSCESSQPPFVSATVDGPSQFFNSFAGSNGNRNNNNNGFVPFGGQTSEVPDFQPNNNLNYNNFGSNQNQNNNNMNANKNENFNWNPNFNWNNNNNNNNGNNNKQAPINNGAGTTEFANPFQPNPNQKFVFNFNKNQGVPNGNNQNNNNQNIPVAEVKPKVATLAIPGASCKSNEICVGGSICTLPIGICLCPGDLEAHEGECVLPAASTISVQKVGIGALCSDLAECDHGSTCVMGRCTCVSPLIQFEGKCVLRQQQKLVGPGELCDNGEICGKGSVCDVMIPVCVCPAHTDLSNGECITVSAPVTQQPVMTPPPTLPPVLVPVQVPVPVPVQVPVQIPVQTLPPPTRPPPPPPVLITQPQIQPTVYYQTTPPPPPPTYATTPVTIPFVPKQIYTSPPQLPKSSVKINQMKIGGSKQAGVGVRCSLNTDCMIGAYCNGNTNPPSCQCLSTHVNIEGRCEKVIYPGQVGCRSDLQCHSAYSSTHCIDRICVCPEGQKAVDQTCVSGTSLPNQPCGYSSINPCSNQSVCFQNLCICPDRYSHNSSSHSCDVTFPEHTECSKACYYPRACVNNICICPDNIDCLHQNGDCISPLSHGAFKNINNQCTAKDRCAGGSKCKDSLCQCVDGAVELTGKCKQFPGGHCSNGEMCSGGSSCFLGKCRCDPSRTLDNQRCVQTTVPIGSTCRRGQQCVNGAACRFGMCMCVSKTIAVLGRCVHETEAVSTSLSQNKIGEEKKPGMPCSTEDTCLGGSTCQDGVCFCEADLILDGDRCIVKMLETSTDTTTTTDDLTTTGNGCLSDNDCSDNSLCTDGKCTCTAGFKIVGDNCLPEKISFSSRPSKSTPGSQCTTTSECSFRTKCIDGVCRCKKGETIIDSTCRTAIHHVLPGLTCDPSNGYDCVGESICEYGVCKCKRRLVSDGQKCVPLHLAMIVIPGKSCANDEPCGGGSYCAKDGICRCPNDEVVDVNKKCVKKNSVVSVFNKIKPIVTTTPPTTITTTFSPTTTTTVDNAYIQRKIDELERLEMEFKNTIPTESSLPAVHRPSSTILAGHLCTKNSECPSFSFCFANSCHCMAGFRATSGICESAIAVGEPCMTSNQCFEDTECIFGVCTCTGANCKDTKMAHPGEDCTFIKTVCSYNSYCSLMSGVCECPSGMATKGTKCENTFESIGKDCVTSRNCQKSSYCDNGYCVCKNGHKIENTMCFNGPPEIKSFSILPFDKNEGENSPVQNFMKNEFKGLQEMSNEGMFHTTTKWPEILTFTMIPPPPDNNQPNSMFPQIFSSFPIAYGAKTVAEEENNSTMKYKIAFPGEYCGNGEVCLGNSICQDHFCRCLQDVAAENGLCPPQVDDLRVLGLQPLEKEKEVRFSQRKKIEMRRTSSLPLDNCQNEETCENNSTCQSILGLGKICQCVEGTVLWSGECMEMLDSYSLVAIDGACDEDSMCLSGSDCISGTCSCSDNKRLILGICVVTALPETSCENGEVCINGSVCGESECECAEGSVNDDGNCVAVLRNESEEKEEVGEAPEQTSGSNETDEENELRSVVRRELATIDCSSDTDCQSNFKCQEYVCVCDGATEHCLASIVDVQVLVTPGTSEPVTSPPGGSCSNLRECTGGSVCREGWCICPDPSMIVNRGICIQSGPKPTLPPRTTIPQVPLPPQLPISVHVPQMTITKAQPFVTEAPPQGKKIVPGGRCGPIDVCVGGSNCIEGFCLCPAGQQPSNNGRCEKFTTTPRQTTWASTTSTQAATARVYSKPGESCTQGQTCVGGSACSFRKLCECPQDKSEILSGQCVTPKKVEVVPGASCNANSVCTKGSTCDNGLCRCQPGYIAVSGNCVALPMPTTPKMKTMAKPFESCENGETCEGGSSCDMDTGICMCPPGQIVFNVQCMPPPTQPQITTRVTVPVIKTVITTPKPTFATDCERDANCGENKICVSRKCKCRPGFVDNSGTCEPLEDIDAIERPIPVSYAKHKVATLSERMLPKEEIELSNIEPVTTATPARQETQKPRIVGPPIRRPRPKNKGSGGSGGLIGNSGGSRSYKTGSGNGNCPPGNEATRDDSGKLIVCNGLEPNCPPRSYCYITSGGFATEEYNCCKSW